MNEQNLQMVFGYLDKVSEKIGVGATQIWPWLIRQQYIDAIRETALFIFLTSALFFLAKFTIKHWDYEPEDGRYSITKKDHEVLYIIPVAILTFLSIVSIFCAFSEITDLLNIQYAALEDLMEMINPKQS